MESIYTAFRIPPGGQNGACPDMMMIIDQPEQAIDALGLMADSRKRGKRLTLASPTIIKPFSLHYHISKATTFPNIWQACDLSPSQSINLSHFPKAFALLSISSSIDTLQGV